MKTTKLQSQHLKDDGIDIFALGVGSNAHSAELIALASDESHVFRFMSVRQMTPAASALRIALALCSGKQDKQGLERIREKNAEGGGARFPPPPYPFYLFTPAD